ncbi:MAG: DUF234 domain-containing protein, partial [Candidatus Natronoplasma sp.]
IDVVGLDKDKKRMILGECKWSKNKAGIDLFYDLKQKSEKVRWNNGKREEEYILFSKSGFEKKFDQINEGVNLIDIFFNPYMQ